MFQGLAAVVGCSTGGFKVATARASHRFSDAETASRFDAEALKERFYDSVWFRDRMCAAFVQNSTEIMESALDAVLAEHPVLSKNVLDRLWTDAVTVIFLNRGVSLMTLGLVLVTLTEHQTNHQLGYSGMDETSTLRSHSALKRVLKLALSMSAHTDCVAWIMNCLGKPIPENPPLNSKGRVLSTYSPVYDRAWTAVEPMLNTCTASSSPLPEQVTEDERTRSKFVRRSLHLPHVWKMYLDRVSTPTRAKSRMFRARLEEYMVYLSTLIHAEHPRVQHHVPDVQPVLEEIRRLALIMCADEWDQGDEPVQVTSNRREALFTFFDYFRIRSYSGTSDYVPAWSELQHTIEKSKHIQGVTVASEAQPVLYSLFQKAVKLTKGPHTSGSDVFPALRHVRSHIHTRPQGLPWLCLATLSEGRHILHRLHILLVTELVARDLILPAFRGLVLGDLCRSLLDDATALWTYDTDQDVRASEHDQFEFLQVCIKHCNYATKCPPGYASHNSSTFTHDQTPAENPARLLWGTANSLRMLQHLATAEPEDITEHLVMQPDWGMETMLLRCSYVSSFANGGTEALLQAVQPRTRVAARLVVTGILMAGHKLTDEPGATLSAWNTLRACCTLEGILLTYQNCLCCASHHVEWYDVRVPRVEVCSPAVRTLIVNNDRMHGTVAAPTDTPAGRFLFSRGYTYSFWSSRHPPLSRPRITRPRIPERPAPSMSGVDPKASLKVVVDAGTAPPPTRLSNTAALLFPSTQSCSIQKLTAQSRRGPTRKASGPVRTESDTELPGEHRISEAEHFPRVQWTYVPSISTMLHPWVEKRIRGWIERMYNDSLTLRLDALPLSKCFESTKYQSILGARQNHPFVLYVRAEITFPGDIQHVSSMLRPILLTGNTTYAPISSARFCALASAHEPHAAKTSRGPRTPRFFETSRGMHSLHDIADTFLIALAWFSRIRFAAVNARCASQYEPLLIREYPVYSCRETAGSLLLPDIDFNANDKTKAEEYPIDISRTYTAWQLHLSAHFKILYRHRQRVNSILSFIAQKTGLPWILAQWELLCQQRALTVQQTE